MSRHVRPERWADAVAGRVAEVERAAMSRHAAACERCAAARDRVTAASGSFPALRAQAAPELAWDEIRARVHWSVSSERNARERSAALGTPGAARTSSPRRAILVVAAAGALGAAAIATLELRRRAGAPSGAGRPAALAKDAAGGAPASAHAAVPGGPGAGGVAATPPDDGARPGQAPPGEALVALVSRASGEVRVADGAPGDRELFGRPLGAGAVVSTGEGRVDLQLGAGTGVALGARSRLEVRRLDRQGVELAVAGAVDVLVEPRGHGQRFVVVAGDRTVEVHGTGFRVVREGDDTTVACGHGLVAVRDAGGVVELGAAQQVTLRRGQAVAEAHVTFLASAEVARLAAGQPALSPIWFPDAPARLADASAPLAIAAPGGARRAVRVDGVELGEAPLRVRVAPGRHLVEAADGAGRFRRVGWADVAAGAAAASAPVARVELPAEAPPAAAARRRELRAGIDQARLARCVRSIAKAGLTGTYVAVELAVDASGAVGYLNVVDTDLPSATAACVREVLAAVAFGPGGAAAWRERVDL